MIKSSKAIFLIDLFDLLVYNHVLILLFEFFDDFFQGYLIFLGNHL